MIWVIAELVILFYGSTLLILWWTLSTARRHRSEDLRRHRDALLSQIHHELIAQENRLAERLKSLH